MSIWRSAFKSFIIVLVLGGVALGIYYILFVRPFDMAESDIPQGGAKLTEGADGLLTLSWPEAGKADRYLVELTSGEEVLWSTYTDTASCRMPGELPDGDVLLKVTPMALFDTPNGEYYRPGDEPLTAAYPARTPSFEDLAWTVDPERDTLTLTWDTVRGGTYAVLDDSGRHLVDTTGGRAVITFGIDLPAPLKGETARLTLSCDLEGFDVDFSSERTVTVDTRGDELLDTAIRLDVKDLGNNRYEVTWNETGGDRYEVALQLGDGGWTSAGSRTDSDGRSCVLGPLEPFENYRIRVSAAGADAVSPGEASIATGSTVIYATVWMSKNMDVWADTAKTRKVGTATTDTSYCVMDEENGFFLIYVDGAKGWVDSTYCLINLPDYMGDLADYDIKNSYDSIYMVNDYGIPGITGTVICGYEQVGSDYTTVTRMETVRSENTEAEAGAYNVPYEMENVETSEPSEFLVPLLYPTAKKVAEAALAARADGYRLKIYDAYRPYIATRFLYDLTEGLLQDEVPEYAYCDMVGAMWDDYLASLAPPPEESAPDEETPEGALPDGDVPIDTDAPEREPRPSYYTVMTDGRYSLSAFLARGGSMHNLGVAVDLTLESIETGQELTMQTSMHDLSWHSVLRENNENAKLLAKYMTGADLGPLSSEWWHFQDDELRSNVKDLARRQDGVTRAGWVFDGTGWRFRTGDGEFLKSGTFKVNAGSYTFDASGYADYAKWENT